MTWAERAKVAITQNGQTGTVDTDETAVTRLLAVSAVVTEAASNVSVGLSSVLAVPSALVSEKHDACTPLTQDPDRWCWPHSPAMNGSEIETFEIRMNRFTQKGLPLKDAEALADKLVLRDRELDTRWMCVECVHLAGHAGSWDCRAWQRGGVAVNERAAGLSGDLVQLLQRCCGFKGVAT